MSEPMRWDVPRPEFIPEQDWQSHDGRIMVVLAAEYDRLKRVVDKLKGMVSHYETCATVDRYDDEAVPCDCGLEKELDAIEKGDR